MRVPLSWLREHIDLTSKASDCDHLASLLTGMGLEVESVMMPPDLSSLRVAQVTKKMPHPHSDRLSLCEVHDGVSSYWVVCGAPNVRASMMSIYAPLGSVLPSGLTIEKREIRSVVSEGMLCSCDELGIGEDASGIIDLGDDVSAGDDVATVLSHAASPIFVIALTPDRGDAASIYGVARDLAAAGAGQLKARHTPSVVSDGKSEVTVSLARDCGCDYFTGRVIRSVQATGMSPLWLRMALLAAGMRSISPVVDITNYIMLTYGHPLHAFDGEAVAKGLEVRRAFKGESFVALDGETYALDEGMTVVASGGVASGGVVSLAGVMGGAHSGIHEGSEWIFLESAYFDAKLIARAGRQLGIASESRYRFERHADGASVVPSLDAATSLILSVCGGTASSVVTAGKEPSAPPSVPFCHQDIAPLSGYNMDDTKARHILTQLGFTWNNQKTVSPPSWRRAITCTADVVGELVRITGFDAIEERFFHWQRLPVTNEEWQMALALKQKLASRGFCEVMGWSFISPQHEAFFGEGTRLANPMHQGQEMLRPSLLPRLLEMVRHNQDHGVARQSLFEMGAVWRGGREYQAIAALRVGDAHNRHWRQQKMQWDVFDIKGEVLAIIDAMGIFSDDLLLQTQDLPSYLHSGQGGRFSRNGDDEWSAYFGMIHPQLRQDHELAKDVAMFEIITPRYCYAPPKRTRLWQRPAYPSVSRDFAFLVARSYPAEKLLTAARQAAGDEVLDVTLFDVFTGKGVSDEQKSLAINITWQPHTQTMNEDTIAQLCQRVIDDVCRQTQAVMRDGDGVHS